MIGPSLAPRRHPNRYGISRRLVNTAALALCVLIAVAVPVRAAPLTLLALGDSLTAGYGLPHSDSFPTVLEAALRARGHDVRVLNAGVSGDTTAGGRSRLGWSLADDPDAVIVALGANDGLRGIPPADTRENLAAILDTLAEKDVPVLLAGMYAPPNMGREYGDAFRKVFEDLAARHDLVFYPFFLDGVAAKPALNQADGMHPNAEGVRVIVERMLPAVERLIALARPEG